MTGLSLQEFLQQRFAAGGFTTEDALVSFLPLLRQVLETHAAGQVAPLDGLGALNVAAAQIWFENAARQAPRNNAGLLNTLDAPPVGAIEVLVEQRCETEVEAGQEVVTDLRIGKRDEPLVRPVYLPGYACWEHVAGHHDPLADTFCLGMILGSMMTRLDFNDPEQLKTFVGHRGNLFRLNPALHPVLAKAIVRMTELSRHRRPQDLRAVCRSLENYRDQAVDLEFDLASREDEDTSLNQRQRLLSRLQERLFEISSRNRLLHFRPTLGTVNLTQASVPLSFDVANIRPDQLLTWHGAFRKAVVDGGEILLNRYLNFNEMPYLPGQFDRIRAEAQKDQAEFGFEQLRLVVCFLRWANVKEKPAELYTSPLVLLPVRLVKKKGIRDSFWIQPLEDEAEVNPVVRYLFQRLYGISLPETVPLTEKALDDLHLLITARVQASEPGISINKIDRPRIDLIHDLAKRRLDSFNRQTRLSGRSVRQFLDLDYSYTADNYHPLGIRLFSARIRRLDVHLKEILQEKPSTRHFLVDGTNAVSQREKRFYSLRESGDDNPYVWEYDLCCVTLGNFKYRKMSLVRDYDRLIDEDNGNPAFDTVFSLAPRPAAAAIPPAPLEDRHHVVSADPTQTAAIAMARRQLSYIIQGPPGTGKSQTITNLIADYAVQGRRVLFVCEKRAAIDVVFHRLQQCGLGELCCLIHDSQTDKKGVIADLKATYEAFLSEEAGPDDAWSRRRRQLLWLIRQELDPLQGFHDGMTGILPENGIATRQLLDRALALAREVPELTARQQERLPAYGAWHEHRERIGRFLEMLKDLQPDAIFAHHPLRQLGGRVVQAGQPLEFLLDNLAAARTGWAQLNTTLATVTLPGNGTRQLAELQALTAFAGTVAELAEWGVFAMLDPDSEPARRLQARTAARQELAGKLAEIQTANRYWRKKLPPEDTSAALAQSRIFDRSALPFLKPAWWRLRRIVNEAYDFAAHAFLPTRTQVLESLEREYAATAELAKADAAFRQEFGIPLSPAELAGRLASLRQGLPGQPEPVRLLQQQLLAGGDPRPTVRALVAADRQLAAVMTTLEGILATPARLESDRLPALLDEMEKAADQLPEFLLCLAALSELPEPLAFCFREFPLTPAQLEAAMATRSLTLLFRTDRRLNRFSAGVRRKHLHFLSAYCKKWEELNAASVRESVRRRFLTHVRLSSAPAAGLDPRQREFKKHYETGRKELEHEFGKVMRFKSIRDLASGDSGMVLRDLKPVWLMSPLSVSDSVPLDASFFDVVIFDEASQITLEEAVPAIFRARQAIVVGDEMQLPPTTFFSTRHDDGDEPEWLDDDEEETEYDLSSNSFLGHAARNMPAQMLGWHYRSRSESLISFSNWAFYQGRLLTVPEEELATSGRNEIVANAAADGSAHADSLLERPVSFHFMEKGVYLNRRNRMEADYIAQMVRSLLNKPERRSIGIVAFSEAQQDEIESALDRLAKEDKAFSDLLEAEFVREVDDQYVGLLIKNLENIQGDERDIIILSVCYGHGPDGRMLMNFGPINQSGGEKRLNVAFSRAKRHMAVVSSIQYSDIRNDYNDGANCLKNYLRYAACISVGDGAGAARILRDVGGGRDPLAEAARNETCLVTRQLAESLRERGYGVDLGVGMSNFRCDLAVRRDGDTAYRLGILVDSHDYYRQDDILERDLMKPRLLEVFGWQITQVLAKDWYLDRQAVLAQLLQRLEPAAATPADEPALPAIDIDALLQHVRLPDEPPPIPAGFEENGDLGKQEAFENGNGGPATLEEGKPLRFEFQEGNSRKFWEIRRNGAELTVRFGRIGTAGQTKTETHSSPETAISEGCRRIRSKTAKGYRPA